MTADPTTLKDAPGAWLASDMREPKHWTIDVEPDSCAEAVAAVRRLDARPLTSLEREDLPLGALEAPVMEIDKLVTPTTGPGFAVLRGLPVADLTTEQAEKLFWAVGLRIGEPVSQNLAGEFMVHVKRDPGVSRRGYSGDTELNPHCDNTELALLFCLTNAESGGGSAVVSIPAVHNTMRTEVPELLAQLYHPFYFSRLGEQHPWERPFSIQPIFTDGADGWGALIGYATLYHAQQLPNVPAFTAGQEAALQAFKEVSNRESHKVSFELQPGDVLVLHNAAVLHARTAFEDSPDDPARQRHLLRLWLDRESAKPWPVRYDFRFGNSGLTRAGTVIGAPAELRERLSGDRLYGHSS